jgi:hypothetical protein
MFNVSGFNADAKGSIVSVSINFDLGRDLNPIPIAERFE